MDCAAKTKGTDACRGPVGTAPCFINATCVGSRQVLNFCSRPSVTQKNRFELALFEYCMLTRLHAPC